MFVWWSEEDKKKAMKNWPAFLITVNDRIINYKNEFKCVECNGWKTKLADDAFCDPVEGYKFANKVTCPTCNGTGLSSEKDWKNVFKILQTNYKAQMKEEKETEKLKKSALKKLTKDERKALGF